MRPRVIARVVGGLPKWVECIAIGTRCLLLKAHRNQMLTLRERAFIDLMTADLMAELQKVGSEAHRLAKRAMMHWTGSTLRPIGIIEDIELVIHATMTGEDKSWHPKVETALEFFRILAKQAWLERRH